MATSNHRGGHRADLQRQSFPRAESRRNRTLKVVTFGEIAAEEYYGFNNHKLQSNLITTSVAFTRVEQHRHLASS